MLPDPIFAQKLLNSCICVCACVDEILRSWKQLENARELLAVLLSGEEKLGG